MDRFRDLSSIPKLVLVGLVLLVLLVILSPLAAIVAGVLLGASVIALIIRVVQKGSIENYGWWPWANPLIFALVCILVSTMLAALVGLSFSLIGGMQGAASAFGRLLLSVIFYPLLAVAGLFVGAGIYHLLLGLVVGQQRLGFGTTLRVYTYTSVALLIAWIPVLGWLLAPIWSVLLAIFGIREAHNTPTSKAALVVLIPPAVVLLFLFLLLAILLILSRLL